MISESGTRGPEGTDDITRSGVVAGSVFCEEVFEDIF